MARFGRQFPIHPRLPKFRFFTGPIAYTSTPTGALSFTGNLNKIVFRSQTASLGFTGAMVKSTVHPTTATLTFTGAMTRRSSKSLTGGLSFTGAFTKRLTRTLTAVLSFTGAFVKRLSRALSGVLSFTGSFLTGLSYLRTFTAALGFTGAMSIRTNHSMTAGLGFTGAITRAVTRTLTAGLSFTGAMFKSVRRTVTAALSFTGAFAKRVGKAFIAGLSFVSGDRTNWVANPTFETSTTGWGTAGQALTQSISQSVAFATNGTTSLRAQGTIDATHTFGGPSLSGFIPVVAGKSYTFSADVKTDALPTGAAVQGKIDWYDTTGTNLGGAALGSSLTTIGTSRRFVTGAAPAGTIKATPKFFVLRGSTDGAYDLSIDSVMWEESAVLGDYFDGSTNGGHWTGTAGNSNSVVDNLAKLTTRTMTGGLSFTGAFLKQLTHAFTATLSFTGNLFKLSPKAFTAVLSFTGSLVTGRLALQLLTATLSFTGGFSKRSNKSLTAGLGFTGAILRSVRHIFTAGLGFTGNMTKRLAKTAFTGILSFTGSLVTGSLFSKVLTAALSFTGAFSKRTGHKMTTAVLSFTGAYTKRTAHKMTAGLSFTGNISRFIRTGFSSTLSFIGTLLSQKFGIPSIISAVSLIVNTFTNRATDDNPASIATVQTRDTLEDIETSTNTSTLQSGKNSGEIQTGTNQKDID